MTTYHSRDLTFRIERLTPDRLGDVATLFKLAFNTDVPIAEIRHKHECCHGDIRYVAFLAYESESGEPAAFYAVFPFFLVVDGKRILAAQSGDTMTNPAYQKQGLFVRLAEHTYDFCRANDIRLITGMPNSQSYPGFMKRLGFKELPHFVNICLLENRFELARFTRGIPMLSKWHRGFIKWAVRLFSIGGGDSLANSNEWADGGVSYALHDDLFFRLKFKADDLLIRIAGVDLWLRVGNNHIEMVDMGRTDAQRIAEAVRRLKLIVRVCGYRFLNGGATSNSYLYSMLIPYAMAQSSGYRLIYRELDHGTFPEKMALLNCDVDVF